MSDDPNSKSTSKSRRYLVFSLQGQIYGIPLEAVKEVIAVPKVTQVPDSAPHFKGIIDLRGKIVSIIDLRLKFKIPPSANAQENAVVILNMSGVLLGAVVDSVDSVLEVQTDELKPPPEVSRGAGTDCVTGIAQKGEKLVLILDIERALSPQERDAVRKNAGCADLKAA